MKQCHLHLEALERTSDDLRAMAREHITAKMAQPETSAEEAQRLQRTMEQKSLVSGSFSAIDAKMALPETSAEEAEGLERKKEQSSRRA